MSATVANLVLPKFPGGNHQTHLLWHVCLFKVCVGACPSPFLQSSRCPALLLHVLFSFLYFIQFFSPRAGVTLPRGLCWFTPRVALGVLCATSLLICWSVSPKQVRSWCLVAQEPSWFLRILWHGEVMCRLGAQGCCTCASFLWFYPARCVSSISARFLLCGAHAICFLTLVTILEPSWKHF
jgi:hypothetical protein